MKKKTETEKKKLSPVTWIGWSATQPLGTIYPGWLLNGSSPLYQLKPMLDHLLNIFNITPGQYAFLKITTVSI